MIRRLRPSRSLPTLRSTALSHATAPPTPVLPFEFALESRTLSTTAIHRAPRLRKSVANLTDEVDVLVEPKKRGRPRKDAVTRPTTHKRSNSTDAKAKKTQKAASAAASVPSIPHPDGPNTKSSKKSGGGARKSNREAEKEKQRVPLAADKYQDPPAAPIAKDEHVPTISTTDGGEAPDTGRVRALAGEAEQVAESAVHALDRGGSEAQGEVQELLNRTIEGARTSASGVAAAVFAAADGGSMAENSSRGTSGSNSGSGSSSSSNKSSDNGTGSRDTNYEEGSIPQGEKTALLGMFGLGSLWVVFGGRFTKKQDKSKK